jgi:hypothetical protein
MDIESNEEGRNKNYHKNDKYMILSECENTSICRVYGEIHAS